jgi:hypothetical protein
LLLVVDPRGARACAATAEKRLAVASIIIEEERFALSFSERRGGLSECGFAGEWDRGARVSRCVVWTGSLLLGGGGEGGMM